jgi:uncharacterized protein
MPENANMVATRNGYEAFAKGDLDGIRNFLEPDVIWHQVGHDAISGDYRGIDAVLAMMTKEFELSGGDITVELVDVYSTDTRTVAVEHLVAHRNGKTLDKTFPIVFNGQGGKAREVWAYPFGDDDALADFWS